jgi:hypothetical protein
MATVAIFGAGDIGEAVLRHLARQPEITRLLVLDIDPDRISTVCHDASAIAAYEDRGPYIAFQTVDMRSEDEIHEALTSEEEPDVIVNTATLQSWWAITHLPTELYHRLEFGARFGPWLPLHLVPILNLMRARRRAMLSVPVVNVAFPDAVNAVLGKLGMSPVCGAGNSELLWAGIRLVAAQRLGVPVEEVELRMVGHHFHVVYYWVGLEEVESLDDHPFHLRVTVDGQDLTEHLGARDLLGEAGRCLPKGRAIAPRVAASVAKNVLGLLREDAVSAHVSGPMGLVGGYDVRLSNAGVEVVPPPGMSLEKAQEINLRSQRGDGIERIGGGGDVEFSLEAHQTMKDVLGYDCTVLQPSEIETRADDLKRRLVELADER